MDTPTRRATGEQRITREELRRVIRHAAELYAAERQDSEERLSEEEVLRVAGELGLPARHVRQALYELPTDAHDRSLLDHIYGRPTISAARSIPADPEWVLERLEEYLSTREYLQVRRRRPAVVELGPANDMISGLARKLRRPEGRFHLAHADRVRVTARPLEPGHAHLRLDLGYPARRRRLTFGGAGLGALAGVALGAGLTALAESVVPGALGTIGEAAAYVGGVGSGLAGGIAASAVRFRRRARAARMEAEGLLDRLQRGDRLEPPPAPWLRRLKRGMRRQRRRLTG